jgi:thymidylate kinase
MPTANEVIDHAILGLEKEASADSIPGIFDSKQNEREFLLALFRAFEEHQVRYCVLHSWETLPQALTSDLDITVHPDDRHKLVSAFQQLREEHYRLIAVINYFIDAYAFQFSGLDSANDLKMKVSVDIIFGHQAGPFSVPSAKQIVAGRRRHDQFWIPSPDTEFTYLLARRVSKGSATPRQERRLKDLIAQLGLAEANRLAAKLLPRKIRTEIIDACVGGQLDPTLARLRKKILIASFIGNPLRLTWQICREKARLLRRWLRPTGLFIAVFGPDGSGKSTMIQNLTQQTEPLWRATDIFHWRPMLLFRRKTMRDTTQPHSIPQRNSVASSIRVIAHLLDYWAGYWLLVRPSTVRTGAVVFDRYFDDMLVDPLRYRYGGPLWLLRFLGCFVPRPDLIFVLDAPEETILSRKQEITAAEVTRQRQLYLECARRNSCARIIDATRSITEISNDVTSAVIEFLSQRVDREHADWIETGANTVVAKNLVQDSF